MSGQTLLLVLGTVTALTGYFQNRLNAQATVVYDFRSISGGVLPQVNYRFNQDFTVTVGAAIWFGRDQMFNDLINPIGPSVNPNYETASAQFISHIRDRDERFFILSQLIRFETQTFQVKRNSGSIISSRLTCSDRYWRKKRPATPVLTRR